MEKFKIKLNKSEQEALLIILINFDIGVFDELAERCLIKFHGKEIVRRFAKHTQDMAGRIEKDWALKLNVSEAYAMQKIMYQLPESGHYPDLLSQKISWAIFKYFRNLEIPQITSTSAALKA